METLITEHPWNIPDLQPPRIHFENSSPTIKNPIRKAIVKELSLSAYRNQIYTEILTLSKFLSQRKNKYRSDKGFKTIQKVDKAINRIYQLDLKSSLSLIKLNLVDTFVPSKQLLQWLLIRLQSYSKLLHRVNDCCYYSAARLNHRLRTGHNWIEIMTALSMMSRIWALSKFLLKHVCSTFDQLHSELHHLPVDSTENQWLFTDYKFPDNLKEWLSKTGCDILSDEETQTLEISSDLEQFDLQKRKITKIKSHQQLKKFLLLETKRRSKTKTKQLCISKNLDAMQWHMFSRQVLKWIRILRKSDVGRQKKLLKKIKLKMFIWLL